MVSLFQSIFFKGAFPMIWILSLAFFTCVHVIMASQLFEKKASLSDVECHGPNMEFKPNENKCGCVDGTYGDAEFFCTKSLDHFCTIRDPQMMESFAGDSYFYDYPCLQIVAEIHMTRDNQDLNILVLLSSSYDRISNIVLDTMGIHLSNLSVYVNKDGATINGVDGNIDTIPDYWRDKFRILNENTWVFALEDFMVMLRPFDPDSPSNLTPGLQVAYNGDTRYHVHEVYELCSHVLGEFEDAKINMGYKYSEIYALMLSVEGYAQISEEQKRLAQAKLQHQCSSVSAAYTNCIIDHQTLTLNRCGPLLTNSVIRVCMTYSGYNVMDIFNLCVKATCELNMKSCEKLKTPSIHGCYTDLELCTEHILQNSNVTLTGT